MPAISSADAQSRLKADIVNGLLLEKAPEQTAGEACSLDHYLVQPDDTMDARIAAARETLGTDAIILGHHYQRD